MCRSLAGCAKPSVSCGETAFPRCAADHAECAKDVIAMVTTPLMVLANIASAVCTFGTATAGTMAARAGVKMAILSAKIARLGGTAVKLGNMVVKISNKLASVVGAATKAFKATQAGNALSKMTLKGGKLLDKFGGQITKSNRFQKARSEVTHFTSRNGRTNDELIDDWASAADEAISFVEDIITEANEMYKEFNNMLALLENNDLLRVDAGNYVADEAARVLGGVQSPAYKQLSLFFMMEKSYIVAKDNLKDNVDMLMSLADPTGLVDVYQAFDAGLCKRNMPFPFPFH